MIQNMRLHGFDLPETSQTWVHPYIIKLIMTQIHQIQIQLTCEIPELEFIVHGSTDDPGPSGIQSQAGDGPGPRLKLDLV